MDSDKLLEIEDLKTHFFVDEGVLAAVDGVSLTIDRHKTVGIIGESGCGKTVMAQSVLQIVPPREKWSQVEFSCTQTEDLPSILPASIPSATRSGKSGVVSCRWFFRSR